MAELLRREPKYTTVVKPRVERIVRVEPPRSERGFPWDSPLPSGLPRLPALSHNALPAARTTNLPSVAMPLTDAGAMVGRVLDVTV